MLVAAERHLAIGCDASRSPENTKGLFALLLFMEIQSIPGSVPVSYTHLTLPTTT